MSLCEFLFSWKSSDSTFLRKTSAPACFLECLGAVLPQILQQRGVCGECLSVASEAGVVQGVRQWWLPQQLVCQPATVHRPAAPTCSYAGVVTKYSSGELPLRLMENNYGHVCPH
jgi:hypothetical protein